LCCCVLQCIAVCCSVCRIRLSSNYLALCCSVAVCCSVCRIRLSSNYFKLPRKPLHSHTLSLTHTRSLSHTHTLSHTHIHTHTVSQLTCKDFFCLSVAVWCSVVQCVVVCCSVLQQLTGKISYVSDLSPLFSLNHTHTFLMFTLNSSTSL